MDKDPTHTPFYKSLYFQVITAIVLGIQLGHIWPETGAAKKTLGDGFIKQIKKINAILKSIFWYSLQWLTGVSTAGSKVSYPVRK